MKVIEVVIACNKIDDMVAFYTNVFYLKFDQNKIPQGIIYESQTNDLKLTMCPSKIAGITAKKNKQQLTFQINSIKRSMNKVEQLGGSIISKLQETANYRQIAIRDVDGNSIILRECI